MTSGRASRWRRLGYAAATGAGAGSMLVWIYSWLGVIQGNLIGPDFVSFYAAARLYVERGGSAVYDLVQQKQI